jgi:hypothetical protein
MRSAVALRSVAHLDLTMNTPCAKSRWPCASSALPHAYSSGGAKPVHVLSCRAFATCAIIVLHVDDDDDCLQQ